MGDTISRLEEKISETSDLRQAFKTVLSFFFFQGDATVVWKLGDRVIYADRVHIGKDLRASIIDNTSLVLTGVDTQYTGKKFQCCDFHKWKIM